jgi:2-oxoglutarate ferredoxin oxidoreductase subunit alpha
MTQDAYVDGAGLICHGALHAGVDFFVGYPITPASGIYQQMIRCGVGMSAPDEITALQYLIGASLNGHKAMTATSGPGFMLMAEGIGAALAMEVALTIVLVQRLGPATGSATANAQGDILMVGNIVSGGFVVPTICPSTIEECVEMTIHAVNISQLLRIPVVLLSEKSMVLGRRSIAVDDLVFPEPQSSPRFLDRPEHFKSYGNLDAREVPPFQPLGGPGARVRVTASTHNEEGMIARFNESVRCNTERLLVDKSLDLFPAAVRDLQQGAQTLVISYGYTAYAAKEAVRNLRARGQSVSHLVIRTIFPVRVSDIRSALLGVERVVIAEENMTGLYRRALLAEDTFRKYPVDVFGVHVMGRPITPVEIEAACNGVAAA